MALIERETAIALVKKYSVSLERQDWTGRSVLTLLATVPPVDPIKAAGGCYCRECCRGQEDDAGVMHCHKFHIHKKPDGFCSDGEPREAAT